MFHRKFLRPRKEGGGGSKRGIFLDAAHWTNMTFLCSFQMSVYAASSVLFVTYSDVTLAKILTSNSVGTQLFFLGCHQDNNPGSNFITKKKNLLVSTRKGN